MGIANSRLTTWAGNTQASPRLVKRMVEIHSTSESQTKELAARLAGVLRPGHILALEGPLGSGKTCFVGGVAQGLGLDPAQVSSPTFTICQEYSLPNAPSEGTPTHSERVNSPPTTLIHIDAYRLSGPDDLDAIGWEEIVLAPNSIVAIEWPSRISSALSAAELNGRVVHITFHHEGEHARAIQIAASREVTASLERIIAKVRRALGRGSRIGAPAQTASDTRCRTCGKPVLESNPFFPFCSDRCRLADLNKWFTGTYGVSRPVQAEDENESTGE